MGEHVLEGHSEQRQDLGVCEPEGGGPAFIYIWILYLCLISRSIFNFGLYPHQVEKQVRREEALERLLARQEETAVLVRGLVEQVGLVCISF